MPVEKSESSKVIGATLNRSGMLRFRATHVGKDTALSQIIRIVEQAQASTAQVQRLADQVTRYFVPAVIGVALLAFVGWWAVGNFPQALVGCRATVAGPPARRRPVLRDGIETEIPAESIMVGETVVASCLHRRPYYLLPLRARRRHACGADGRCRERS